MFDRYNIIDEQDLAAAVAKRFAPANGKHPGCRAEPGVANFKRDNIAPVAQVDRAAVS